MVSKNKCYSVVIFDEIPEFISVDFDLVHLSYKYLCRYTMLCNNGSILHTCCYSLLASFRIQLQGSLHSSHVHRASKAFFPQLVWCESNFSLPSTKNKWDIECPMILFCYTEGFQEEMACMSKAKPWEFYGEETTMEGFTFALSDDVVLLYIVHRPCRPYHDAYPTYVCIYVRTWCSERIPK